MGNDKTTQPSPQRRRERRGGLGNPSSPFDFRLRLRLRRDKSPWQEIPKIFFWGAGGFWGDFWGGRNRVSKAPGAFWGVEDSTWSAKRPIFTRLCPRFSPTMGDNRPVFASQNPRFSDYVMGRRGWNGRFPVKFGTGFAYGLQRRERRDRRGELGKSKQRTHEGEGGFNAEVCPDGTQNPRLGGRKKLAESRKQERVRKSGRPRRSWVGPPGIFRFSPLGTEIGGRSLRPSRASVGSGRVCRRAADAQNERTKGCGRRTGAGAMKGCCPPQAAFPGAPEPAR